MKKVGTAMYVHKSALDELLNKIKEEKDKNFLLQILKIAEEEIINYDIIKIDNKRVSLIQSPDWDTKNEPSVGDSICFHQDGTRKKIKASNKIYHCKYLFVKDDYAGFNIKKAKERAKLWNSIPNIKMHKSRIGNRPYWNNLLKENNIPL